MLTPVTSKQFHKDLKKARKQGKEIENMDHRLTGIYSHHRECHIAPDWLLIYKVTKTELRFERTGSHSELFKR